MLFGIDRVGEPIALDVIYWMTLMVDIPATWSSSHVRQVMYQVTSKYRIPSTVYRYQVETYHPTAGFYPDLKSKIPIIGRRPFLAIRCKSAGYFYSFKHFFENNPVHIHSRAHQLVCLETSIPTCLRLLQRCNGSPSGILQVDKKYLQVSQEKFSHYTCEYTLRIHDFYNDPVPIAFVPTDEIYPIRICSFDIEVASPDGRFPKSERPENKIISICTTTRNMKTGATSASVHALETYTEIPDTANLIQCMYPTEAELLEGFRDFLVRDKPAITTGYNTHGFDWGYIFDRIDMVCGMTSRAAYMSPILHHRCQLRTKTFSSSAYGTYTSRYPEIPGLTDMDLYQYVKKTMKLPQYGLGYVARHVLKNQDKAPLSIKEMNACWYSGEPDRRRLIHMYCLQDTVLPLMIWASQCILPSVIEMSRVTYVFLTDLFSRGQSFKVLSQLFIFARNRGYALDTLPDYSKLNTYQGATVLQMEPGFWQDVAVLDFASLYPSIMRALNLCYTSWVKDPEFEQLPGWTYRRVQTGLGEICFQSTVPGILPLMLEVLGASRSQAKKAMRASKTDEERAIYDARQKALKVSMNSIYGFMGATIGAYSCPPIAATVTAYGRHLIAETKRLTELKFQGARVIYGDTDSVMIKFDNIPPTDSGYRQVYALANQIADMISNAFHPGIIILENEKVYRVVIMLKKKKYVALSQETPEKKVKLDVKGVMMVRRDFSPFQQDLFSRIIHILLHEQNLIKTFSVLRERFEELLAGNIPLDDLTLTRQLRGEYKNPNLPQKRVADKIDSRNPGSGPKPGDRVAFIPIRMQGKNRPLYERVECVEYVKKNKLLADYGHFIKSFKTSMGDLFEAFRSRPDFDRLIDLFVQRADHIGMKPLAGIQRGKRRYTKKATQDKKKKTKSQPSIRNALRGKGVSKTSRAS
jgi:DNA polymerase delta subunit 1